MTDLDPLLRRALPPPSASTTPARPTAPIRQAPRRRRGHPAKGARIAAAGLGVSTMLGLVASMGVANAIADQAESSPPPATTPPTTPATPATSPATAATPVPGTVVPADSTPPPTTGLAPVTLTARPEVRVVAPPAAAAPAAPAPAPAPAATTSGSR